MTRHLVGHLVQGHLVQGHQQATQTRLLTQIQMSRSVDQRQHTPKLVSRLVFRLGGVSIQWYAWCSVASGLGRKFCVVVGVLASHLAAAEHQRSGLLALIG